MGYPNGKEDWSTMSAPETGVWTIYTTILKTGLGGGENRISLENVNGDARLILKDGEGNPRINLLVDSLGRTKFEVLDKEGSTVKNLLEVSKEKSLSVLFGFLKLKEFKNIYKFANNPKKQNNVIMISF